MFIIMDPIETMTTDKRKDTIVKIVFFIIYNLVVPLGFEPRT